MNYKTIAILQALLVIVMLAASLGLAAMFHDIGKGNAALPDGLCNRRSSRTYHRHGIGIGSLANDHIGNFTGLFIWLYPWIAARHARPWQKFHASLEADLAW